MATRTRAHLITAVGKRFVGTGQSLEDEDQDTIDEKIDPLLAQLSGDSIITIDNDNEIPLEYFNPLVELLTNVCGPDFGQPYSEEAKRVFEAQLRRTASAKATNEVLRTVYY
jgi:hypothetical protein